MSTASELQTLWTAYSTARAAGEYDAAIGHLMDMQALLAITPNQTRNVEGFRSDSVAWNPAALDKLIAQCEKLKAQAARAASLTGGPFKRIPITYVRETDSGDYA